MKKFFSKRREAPEERAYSHLESVVDQYRRQGRRRLPTAAVLAAQAGVSKNILLRALTRLCATEELERRRGSGIWIGKAPSPPAVDTTPASPRWQQIGAAIGRDIETGAFVPGGRFPSVKQLRTRYGGCGQTVRAALRDLAQRRLIVRRAAGYGLVPPARDRRSGTVVFILSGDPAGNPMFMEERSLHLYWAMTGAAARYGVDIAPYTYMSWDDNLFDARGKMLAGPQQIMARNTVLGFVFWNRGMPRPEYYTRMIQRLLYLGEPVSVIDETGEVDFTSRLVAAQRLLWFRAPATGSAGWTWAGILPDAATAASYSFPITTVLIGRRDGWKDCRSRFADIRRPPKSFRSCRTAPATTRKTSGHSTGGTTSRFPCRLPSSGRASGAHFSTRRRRATA